MSGTSTSSDSSSSSSSFEESDTMSKMSGISIGAIENKQKVRKSAKKELRFCLETKDGLGAASGQTLKVKRSGKIIAAHCNTFGRIRMIQNGSTKIAETLV